ncbi:MAG: lysophospholipid acyltransferase family protein [Thermodesulfobacteriota bacterium]
MNHQAMQTETFINNRPPASPLADAPESGAGSENPPAIAEDREPEVSVNPVQQVVGHFARKNWSVASQDPDFMARQMEIVWDFLLDRYFRVEMDGWENLPQAPSLLAGIHSGTWLTMDAWTLCAQWWRHFGPDRILHGTAHDALMAMPVLGGYFRKVGVIPACREAVTAALSAGHDVIVFPGGEVDSMRSFRKRDQVVLNGRKGFVRQAIRSGVPITPVATIGGTETVFVLSEGRTLAKLLFAKKLLRSEMAPLVLGFPFGITLEALPLHIPLPAKIRTRIMEPVFVDTDPDRADDDVYVTRIYRQVEAAIARGVAELAGQRRFPIFF